MKYERLKENLNVMCMHNHTQGARGRVVVLTNGRKTENQVIDEVVSDCREILNKIEQGTLIELPCKVGDTVYQTNGVRIYESKVELLIYDCGRWAFNEKAIGTSVFLTREEAEKRLEELQNG